MKSFKVIRLILSIAFSIAYCHYASEILFNQEIQEFSREFLIKEYFQSLIVGFCASIPVATASFYLKRRKTNMNLD